MKPFPLNQALNKAVAAAHAAGALMRKNLRAAKTVNAATAHDIKLELDVRCQALIERRLHRAFPQVAFLGEEGVAGDPGAEFRWVVDPIDGTVNFARGIPHASVSIALQRRVRGAEGQPSGRRVRELPDAAYETELGVIYDPFVDELWTAVRGQPAWMNGKRIHVSRRRELRDCIISIGFSKSRRSLELGLPYFAWLARRTLKVRMLGSAALSLTYVATGRLDAYVERSINLWDVAAGGLIVECAGGRFWCEPLDRPHKSRMIASNGLIHRRLPIPR